MLSGVSMGEFKISFIDDFIILSMSVKNPSGINFIGVVKNVYTIAGQIDTFKTLNF